MEIHRAVLMIELQQLLAALPAHDLRTVATRLGVRASGTHRKVAWIAAIVQGWQRPAQAAAWVAALSPTAQAALVRLLAGAPLPFPLFGADYGALHTHRRRGEAAVPLTASDELYSRGLLWVTPATAGTPALVLAPSDLAPLLLPLLPAVALPAREETPPAPVVTAPAFVHDVAQLLLYLHQQAQQAVQPLTWQQGRWLAPRHLAALNERLLHPDPTPLPRSHKQCDRLRTLLFWAEAAGLLRGGMVTATGWAWLAQPPAAQVRLLWHGWQAAAPHLRQAYAMPDGNLPAPWPAPLVAVLQTSRPPWTPAAVTAALLATATVSPLYWPAHFAGLQTLDDLAAALLAGPLRHLGLVAADSQLTPAFGLTPWGAWLLERGDPPPSPPPTPAQGEVQPAAIAVAVPAASTSYAAQAVLAGYAEIAPGNPFTGNAHHYQLTADSVAQAAAQGQGLPALSAALAQLGAPLTTAAYRQVAAWWQAGRAVQVGVYPLLRTTTPDLLAGLIQEPQVRAVLGEVLTPTTALLQGEPATVAQALRAAGHPVVWPGAADAAAMDAAVTPPATATQAPHSSPEVLVDQRQGGALWLAGQLYRLVGEHLALPLPPPAVALAALYQQLPAAEQALLQAQLHDVQERLPALLDHLALTPPPAPSEPAQWQALLEQAMDQQRRVDLHYFSAGRNLLTRRLVDPHWVEERYGVLYLVAYCHTAGRVLTFRLDRIQALAICGDLAPADDELSALPHHPP
ncbi:MAG: WYL domain-containing protein [Caldilineaceae bacterium]